jgi:hypothetical protein
MFKYVIFNRNIFGMEVCSWNAGVSDGWISDFCMIVSKEVDGEGKKGAGRPTIALNETNLLQ